VLIIGERLNCTRKHVGAAVSEGNADFVREEAQKQLDAGAHMLDVNGGIAGREAEYLRWMVNIVQELGEIPICLDSADPGALSEALPLCKKTPMINSITDEPERIESLLPLVKEFGTKVIALCLQASGTPKNAEDRVETALRLVDAMTQAGVQLDNIYIDPCVFPVSTGPEHGPAVIDAIATIKTRFPEVHISCGVSNVSFGLPERRLLNRTFLPMLLASGMDTAIMDPCDTRMMASLSAAEALLGIDEYCMTYLEAHRGGKLADQ
jgi:5-methyltetrahydrofolate--homocysteine methyltransferase